MYTFTKEEETKTKYSPPMWIANSLYWFGGGCQKGLLFTLIQFVKFSAKILLMAKLLQNYSNLNYLGYSRHLKARKVEKRPKKFWRPNKGQRLKNPNFQKFLDFLRLIGSKNWCGAIFFHFPILKGQKGHYKAKS